ncbi:MAG: hypothetical protein ABIP65_11135 [Vicinamibacterales bacterium]
MTKRSLYAQLVTLLLWGSIAVPAVALQQPGPAAPECASCLVVTILPGQVLLLPPDLHGVTVLVRTATADVDPAAMAWIVRRGGVPGILLVPPPAQPTPAQTAFALKSLLAELRSRAADDGILALQVAQSEYRALLAERDVASYADVIVGVPGATSPARVRYWPSLGPTTARAALETTRQGSAERWVLTAPDDALDASALIADVADAAGRPRGGFSEDVEVRGSRRLAVEEIVARHQSAARRQAALAPRSISSGVLTLTFEAPGFPAPVTITSDTVIYTDRDRTELEQRSIRVNGIEFRGGGVPRLPILEPERAAAPPLAITLSDLYRYRLRGEEVVGGVRCYVVAFEPAKAEASLFRGRAWIAMDGFAMVKVSAAQTGLRGAIVSSEQVDAFAPVIAGVWMLARSDVRQIYEGAAHRTPIHRRLSISRHELNPPDFVIRRGAAYASDAVMLRDTAEGYRYLRRERTAATAGSAAQIVPQVAGRAGRVRTLAAGVIIDPNISRPLPFAGISYVDFNLFGTGSQLNLFFGGAYAQLAFSVPSVIGSRWQLAGRAFGIATSYNDRSFRDGRELYAEGIRQRPAHASIWLLRPLTPLVSLRLGYELDYTRLRGAPETSRDFVVPADQVSHSARIAIEGQRGGWAASMWWNPARRSGWRAWGSGSEYLERHRDFQRYGVTVARSTAVTPRIVTRIEGQATGGIDLDRFSRYSFGTFDNRLRGYPSALVRYDRGAVLRGAIAWSASKLVRLDGFVDTAAVHDPGFGSGLRNYTGLGAAAETPAPFGLLTAVEWGYGFRGVRANGRQGTHVIRVSAYKVF